MKSKAETIVLDGASDTGGSPSSEPDIDGSDADDVE